MCTNTKLKKTNTPTRRNVNVLKNKKSSTVRTLSSKESSELITSPVVGMKSSNKNDDGDKDLVIVTGENVPERAGYSIHISLVKSKL